MNFKNKKPKVIGEQLREFLCPTPKPCHHAEYSLIDAAERPNYGLTILRLVAKPSVDDQITKPSL